jgi:alkanesulfonate monooxygenase SsuD/methylene tetrahydromethanopterin reductase-like flavin-dependent oxidoreductase (luciferase family)
VKFSISVSLERFDPTLDMRRVAAHALEMVQIAEQGGFEIAWTPEHHTIEFTIAPNPFSILTHWAAHTKNIRLGTAVVVAPYWHPIRLAGEAALCDVFSNGRLEFGIGRGAYQYEFDRLAGGMPQEQGGAHMREMLPILKALWRGDYEYQGTLWSFPKATSVPKPVQKPYPPIWVAARDASTFDWAIKQGADIQSTPLSRPNSEVEVLGKRFDEVLAANPGVKKPRFLMLRRTCVYESAKDAAGPVNASINYGRHFENLFKNIGIVRNGFPEPVDFSALANRAEYEPNSIRESMMFGTPDEVVQKLKFYQSCGVENFCYGASFGMPFDAQLRSLRLFISDVMPHFQSEMALGNRVVRKGRVKSEISP